MNVTCVYAILVVQYTVHVQMSFSDLRPWVCLSHFSELETGDKQAFDTHNQTPIQTRIQTRFSDVVFIGPFLVGGIKRLSLLLCVFLAHLVTIGRSKATNLWLSNQVG